MFHAIRILPITAIIFCGAMSVAAQTPPDAELPLGKIIEKVAIQADTSQSYAVYLPTTYDPSKKFPILYCFDPEGRGSSAVGKFQAAAEKYGYILVGSNNSRNGLDGPALTSVIRNLWAETNRKFSIDLNRILVAGFSGGARVASSFAVWCNGCVFGVIGCGAGFSPGVTIDDKLPFIFFGTIGYDDFNYPELRDLDKKLTAARVVHRIEAFEGRHQWLDEMLADEALGWFEIRAMKAGKRDKDDRLIGEFLLKQINRAERYFADKEYIEAYSTYTGVVADFAQWRDVSKIADKIKSMDSLPELKRAIRSDADQIRSQFETAGQILSLGGRLRDPDDPETARTELRQLIARLTKQSSAPADSPERRVARRALDQVFVQTFESAVFRPDGDRNYSRALENLEIAGEVDPKNPNIPFNRARIYALQGDKKKAIDSLKKAVELGFKDANRLTNEKAFETLKKDERFVKLLAALKQ